MSEHFEYLNFTKWQVLSEDDHTKYVYDWEDDHWNMVVRQIYKKETPWTVFTYRRWPFKIMIHSKTESSNDIDYWFVLRFDEHLRYEYKERKFSKESEIILHEMKFYNSKMKLYKNQEKLRLKYKLYVSNSILEWIIIRQYKEMYEMLEERIHEMKMISDRISYNWNEEYFEKLHRYEDEKKRIEEYFKDLRENRDYVF